MLSYSIIRLQVKKIYVIFFIFFIIFVLNSFLCTFITKFSVCAHIYIYINIYIILINYININKLINININIITPYRIIVYIYIL